MNSYNFPRINGSLNILKSVKIGIYFCVYLGNIVRIKRNNILTLTSCFFKYRYCTNPIITCKALKLNVCQGYKVMKRLQDIERARAACKKELQRVMLLREGVNKACLDSVSFEYDEYKNRQIEDVWTFIFGEQSSADKIISED